MGYKSPQTVFGYQRLLISRFLDTVGDGSGTKNANGDYSLIGDEFFIKPPADQVFRIARIIITVEDTAGFTAAKYGALAALVSGITIKLMDDDSLTSVADEEITSDHDAWVAFANELLNVGSVVVEPSGGGTAYTEGTDYTIDYQTGRIMVLSTGTMADATAFDCDYDHGATVDLTDGVPVKTNAQYGGLCYDVDVKSWGSGDELLTARLTFTKFGQYIRLDGAVNGRLVVTVNDDLDGLISHRFLAQGFVEDEDIN